MPSAVRWGRSSRDLAVAVVLVAPFVVTLLLQAFHVGTATNIGSDVQTSDSAGWTACPSALAQWQLSSNVDWCGRRPLAFFSTTPWFWLSAWSVAGVVLLQVAALSVAAAVLLRRLLATYAMRLVALWLSVVALVWLVVQYGTSLGPEATALLYALVAAGAFLRMIAQPTAANAVVTVAGIALAFAVRPGNPLLLLAIAVLAVVVLRRAHPGRRVWLAPLVPVALVFVVLNRVLRLTFLPEAGHGSNFWATVYSAADPAMVGWTEPYERFAEEGATMGTETLEFSAFLRDEALSLIISNPVPLVLNAVKNLAYFVLRGWVNLYSGFPFRRREQLSGLRDVATGDRSPFEAGSVGILVLASLAGVLSLLSVYVAFRLGRSFVGQYRAQRADEGAPTPRWRRLWATATSRDPVTSGLTVALASLVGAFLFFGLVGHDEDSRHLVMSVPWMIIGVAALGGVRTPEVQPTTTRRPPFAWVAAGIMMVALVVAFVDGRHHPLDVVATEGCSAEVERWRVVAAAPLTDSAHVDTGSDWRRVTTTRTRHIDTPQFMSDGLLSLSGGSLVSLRSHADGEIITVWSPRDVTAGLRAGGDRYDLVEDPMVGLALAPCR